MPDTPWQLSKKPFEWQQVLANARQALHSPYSSSIDQEDALEAIRMANEALSVYDESESTGGLERLKGGLGGLVGEGEAGLKAIAGLFNAPGAAISGVKKVVTDPEGAVDAIQSGIEGGMNKLRDIVTHPGELTPREVGSGTADVGMLLAPFARTDMASGEFTRGLAPGYGPMTPLPSGPTVGGAVWNAVTKPFRSGASAVQNWLDKPGVTNAMNRARTGAAEEMAATQRARRAGVEATNAANAQIIPEKVSQAQLRTNILGEQLGQYGSKAEQLQQRIELLQQALERGGPTLENLELRNELLKLKLQLAQEGANPLGDLGDVVPPSPSPKPGFTNPEPIPEAGVNAVGNPRGVSVEGPPLKPVTNADRAFSRMRTGEAPPVPGDVPKAPFQSPPFEEDLPIAQKSKWPTLASNDIETYLRQIANYLQSGYK